MSQMAHVMLGDSGKRTLGTNAPNFDGTQPCKGMDTEMFFPAPERLLESKKFLKTVCESCSFQNPCLQWALDNKELGIWAGTDEKDRHSIKRRKI